MILRVIVLFLQVKSPKMGRNPCFIDQYFLWGDTTQEHPHTETDKMALGVLKTYRTWKHLFRRYLEEFGCIGISGGTRCLLNKPDFQFVALVWRVKYSLTLHTSLDFVFPFYVVSCCFACLWLLERHDVTTLRLTPGWFLEGVLRRVWFLR